MQEIQSRHAQPSGMLAQSPAVAWLSVISCALAAIGGVFLAGSAWVGVVFLLLCAAAMVMAFRVSRTQGPSAYSPNAAIGYWQDWLAGWYWQTDEHHRLVVLKPDHGDSACWLTAQRLTHEQMPVWACWASLADHGGLNVSARAALAMMEMRIKSHLSVELSGLPWPVTSEAPGHSSAASCQVLGVPRLDARGQFLGYHGVWRRCDDALTQGSAVDESVLPSAAEAAAQATLNAMTEAEQEVLRYALSHDLRAPLRVVDGFSRILKEDYGRMLDRIGNDHLDRVLAATARMNGMIDAILDQAQLSQAPIERSQIDLSALAYEVAAEQLAARRSDLGGAGSTLDVEWVIEGGLNAQGDPLLIRRVLDNLIGNALKYSGKVAHPRVEVGMVAATDPSVYFVRDNGAGFDMQHADKLFGLFQRLHSTKEFPGSGVGLAGVQNIVRRHGGRVWAEAVPGQGACFYFTLVGSGVVPPKASAPARH
jgi:signal transduction histidine kinase